MATRVYSDTMFGTIWLREYFGGELITGGKSNFEVAGYRANIASARVRDGGWVTALLVQNNEKVVEVELGTRIDSAEQRDAMERLISGLLFERE